MPTSKSSHNRTKSAPTTFPSSSSPKKNSSISPEKPIKNIIDNNKSKNNRPKKLQCYSNGTELDGFDDLPVCLERELASKRHNNDNNVREPVLQNLSNRKNDASKTLTQDIKGSTHVKRKNRQKKPHLICNLNSEMYAKVVGEMVYNPSLQRWDGNESVLKDLDSIFVTPTRPALISNMNPNSKSLQMGKMTFDPTKMCWFHSSSEEVLLFDSDEDEELVEHDKKHSIYGNKSKNHTFCGDILHGNNDNDAEGLGGFISPPLAFSDDDHSEILGNCGLHKGSRRRRAVDRNADRRVMNENDEFQVGSEFDVTKGFLAALMASERQHRKEMNRWYPAIRSISNEQRFGLRDSGSKRGFLYEIKNYAVVNNNCSMQNSGKRQTRKSNASVTTNSSPNRQANSLNRPQFR